MILVPLTRDQAMDFVRKHHRHCRRAAAHRGALGLEWGGALVGVVILGNTCREMMKREPFTVEITRLCVDPATAPRNACSWLYARARRAAAVLGFRKVTTVNLDSESGASLRAAGFALAREMPARPKGYDCPSRPRQHLPTDGLPKNRWEMGCT